MSKFTKQTFIDADVDQVDVANFSLVQLKYDGHWCRLEFSGSNGTGYTTSDRAEVSGIVCPLFRNSIVIGEHLFGTNWAKSNPDRTGKIILFDCVVLHGEDISLRPYIERYSQLENMVTNARHPQLWLPQTYPATRLGSIWEQFVIKRDFEGVVLRNDKQTYFDKLHRCKRDFETTYTCIGFTEGEGKHTGRLGALVVSLPNGATGTVGGGFSDADREYIWTHQADFIGREFDAAGKRLFDSGALRHPNFIRWKEPSTGAQTEANESI
jgi:ATP-dependent DNA ligase